MVYFLSHHSKHGDDWELRYSLRSIVKNFLDLGRVFIVGHRPTWLRGVEYLGIPDYHQHCKDANLFAKLAAACRWGTTDWFLNPSDDQLLLQPLRFRDCKAWHIGNMASFMPSYWKGTRWTKRLLNTFEWLQKHGYPTYHHDGHVPMPIHRDSFLKHVATMPYAVQPGFTIHTAACNVMQIERAPLEGRKHTQGHACHFTFNIDRNLEGRLFCGYNNAGLTEAFQTVIEHRFQQPSPFEADAPAAVPVPIDLDPARERRIAMAGSQSRTFGGVFDGGYALQQIPAEAAEFIGLVKRLGVANPRLLEVGSAAGGFSRVLDDELVCRSITILDDNGQPRHILRKLHLPHAVEKIGPAAEAGPWLAERGEQYDLIIIDTDHVLEHETRHVEVVLPYLCRVESWPSTIRWPARRFGRSWMR